MVFYHQTLYRRFFLVAGALESADREFDNLAKEIDIYANEVKLKVESDDLNIELNTTALKNYLDLKFKVQIDKGLIENTFNNKSEQIIIELNAFGINSLKDLDTLLGNNINKFYYTGDEQNNFLGLLRNIMMISDPDLYFQKAWNGNWRAIDRAFIKHSKKLGIDMNVRVDKYHLDIF
jgi:hypothetical protein